ncbi:MAG: FIG01123341: hypothetical protein [uncultured Nocardioidaceae bacterium]|uniref:DUF664 domain-containing protein n=1 Tax=uncultured Nocardioidaceae bacterium TaxID=253824 RepID=A0A6J4MBX6_9ACTN|nr:MAG: FIG01123341: hypothetical protein [uncultured Nocardioidaceae bacterium]
MVAAELLVDALGRVKDTVHAAVEGLDEPQLSARLDPQANSIAWLVWHLTRVQDDHLAEAADSAQVWLADGWARRFGLPFDDDATGYGQSSADVTAVRAPADLLLGYHDAVHASSVTWLRTVADADLRRVVDERWDPPVTLAVRLVSVVDDDMQHAGQAAFLRGVLDRRAQQPST